MIDKYTGKTLVSPLDMPSVQTIAEEAMALIQNKTSDDVYLIGLVLNHLSTMHLTMCGLLERRG